MSGEIVHQMARMSIARGAGSTLTWAEGSVVTGNLLISCGFGPQVRIPDSRRLMMRTSEPLHQSAYRRGPCIPNDACPRRAVGPLSNNRKASSEDRRTGDGGVLAQL